MSSQKLFSCIQLGREDVPRTAALAHIRTSLKTAISCLTLQTLLMCLLRQTTGRVLFITVALVAASQQARLPHSIKELHLWNLHCLLNCLDGWYLALRHHWHIDDTVDDTVRDTLLGNDLDHFCHSFHDLWYGDVDNLLHGAAGERAPVESIAQLQPS